MPRLFAQFMKMVCAGLHGSGMRNLRESLKEYAFKPDPCIEETRELVMG